MMIDVTDEGTVYNPKTQGRYGSVMSNDDTEFGVRQLQVSNNLILGASDSGYFKRIGETNNPNLVRRKAASDGIRLNLREFSSVFGDYRTTWFDYVAFAILLLVPGSAFLLLARWVWQMRVAQPALPRSQEI